MKRIFLDANVLFTAAHNPHGKAALVIELAERGRWEVYTSTFALVEAGRNLQSKFPEALPALEAMKTVLELTSHHEGVPQLPGLSEKDQPIFRAALAGGATHLLTGDIRDFGRFMNRPRKTHGIHIQTTAEFLADLLA